MKNVHEHIAHPWGAKVLFTQDSSAAHKLGRRYALDTSDIEDPYSGGLSWSGEGCTQVIWVRPGSQIGVLVHECTHAALNILEYVGIHPESGNGEVLCYTLQRMFESFLPHFRTT